MHAVIVLDQTALSAFRSEHPWLAFPEAVSDVTIHFNEEGGPRRMTASQSGSGGLTEAADVDAFGAETILALLSYSPKGSTSVEAQPEIERVWQIIEELPRLVGSSSNEEIDGIEADRHALLEEAFSVAHHLALKMIHDMRAACASEEDRRRLDELADSLPQTLDAVRAEQKPAWSQLDLWSVVAVLRDELALPADHECGVADEASYFSRESLDHAAAAALSGPVIQAMFDLSPSALCLSTLGGTRSRYIRVNQSYLDLVGRTWGEIRGSEMLSTGIVTGGVARARRLELLDREAGYLNEPAEIVSASGERVAVTISARRISIAGQLYDFEILTPSERL